MGTVKKRLERINRPKPEAGHVVMQEKDGLRVARVVVKAFSEATTREEIEDVALDAATEQFPDVQWWELQDTAAFLNRRRHFMVTYREAPIRVVR